MHRQILIILVLLLPLFCLSDQQHLSNWGQMIPDLLDVLCPTDQDCMLLFVDADHSLVFETISGLALKGAHGPAIQLKADPIDPSGLETVKLSRCLVSLHAGNSTPAWTDSLDHIPYRKSFHIFPKTATGESKPNSNVLEVRSLNGRGGGFSISQNCGKCEPVSYIWTNTKGLSTSKNNKVCCKGKDPSLYKQRMSIAIFGTLPFLEVKFTKKMQLDYRGVDPGIVRILEDHLEFRASMRVTRGWYYVDAEGVKKGVVGDVYNRKADFGIGHIGILHERYQLISYTTPPYFSKILFVTTVPRPMDPFLNLVYPFTNTIWAILVASVFTVGATSWLVYKSYSTDSLRPYHTVFDFVLLPTGVMVNQKWPRWFSTLSRTSLGPLFLLTWAVAAWIVGMAYTSTLLASLIAVQYEKPLNTFKDLREAINSRGAEAWTLRESSITDGLKVSVKQEVREIGEKIGKEDWYFTYTGDWPWDVMDSMVSNGTEGAIVNTESTFKVNGDRVYRRYGNLPFRLMSHESLYHGPTGLVVSKGCRYLEQLDKTIGKMVQAGLPEHLFMMGVSSSHLARLAESQRTSSAKLRRGGEEAAAPLELVSLYGALTAFSAVIGASLIIFMREMLVGTNGSRNKDDEVMSLTRLEPREDDEEEEEEEEDKQKSEQQQRWATPFRFKLN